MSETVSPRVTAFGGRATPARRARPLPRGYGLLIGALLSGGLWAGLGFAVFRVWF